MFLFLYTSLFRQPGRISTFPGRRNKCTNYRAYFCFKDHLDLSHRTQLLIRYLFLIYKRNVIRYRARPRGLFRSVVRAAPFHPHSHACKSRTCLTQDSEPGRRRASRSPAPASSPGAQAFIYLPFLICKLCSVQWCQVRV